MRTTQTGLPLTLKPSRHIAKQLESITEQVMACMTIMQQHICTVPNHYKPDYRINGKIAWNIPDEKIDEPVQKIRQLYFV